jgi:glyceraldehyde 3-phosphate dehydrogenase
LPHLKGKLDGFALRVPTPNVSLVDLVVTVRKAAKKEEVNQAFKAASEGALKGYLGYSDEPLVSTDYMHSSFSGVVDAQLTKAMGNLVKVIAWYDNEWGYSCRLRDMVKYSVK